MGSPEQNDIGHLGTQNNRPRCRDETLASNFNIECKNDTSPIRTRHPRDDQLANLIKVHADFENNNSEDKTISTNSTSEENKRYPFIETAVLNNNNLYPKSTFHGRKMKQTMTFATESVLMEENEFSMCEDALLMENKKNEEKLNQEEKNQQNEE